MVVVEIIARLDKRVEERGEAGGYRRLSTFVQVSMKTSI
jgi:hypothetical protein